MRLRRCWAFQWRMCWPVRFANAASPCHLHYLDINAFYVFSNKSSDLPKHAHYFAHMEANNFKQGMHKDSVFFPVLQTAETTPDSEQKASAQAWCEHEILLFMLQTS